MIRFRTPLLTVAVLALLAAPGCACAPSPSPSISASPSIQPTPLTGMVPGPTTSSAGCDTGQICSADAAITTALTTLLTWRPSDADAPTSAAARAAPWLTQKYIGEVGGTWAALAPITLAQFSTEKAAGRTVFGHARVLSEEHPPDTAIRASRVVALTQVAGKRTYGPIYARVIAAATGVRWQINAIGTN